MHSSVARCQWPVRRRTSSPRSVIAWCALEERTKLVPRNKVIKRTLDKEGQFVPAVAYHEVQVPTKAGASPSSCRLWQ